MSKMLKGQVRINSPEVNIWFCQDCGHRTKEDVKWKVVVCGYCGTEMEVEVKHEH